VPAAGEPLGEALFGGPEVAIRNADLLEAELYTPALDITREHSEIRRALELTVLHTPNLKPQITRFLAVERDTLAFGGTLAAALEPGLVIHLRGDLGAGKTTLARGLLRALGFSGRVKSPTYTLVEVYKFSRLYLYHFDFYRFDHPQELADSGFREYFGADAVCLIEWPEKASGLPAADVCIELRVTDEGRTVDVRYDTEVGRLCLERLQQAGIT
jgi:tRNA threonylcarbamoyladenosine biosynthesis protein TsaE